MSEKYDLVIENCPSCGYDNRLEWNIDDLGHRIFCAWCGREMMLCDACEHTAGDENCGSTLCERRELETHTQIPSVWAVVCESSTPESAKAWIMHTAYRDRESAIRKMEEKASMEKTQLEAFGGKVSEHRNGGWISIDTGSTTYDFHVSPMKIV